MLNGIPCYVQGLTPWLLLWEMRTGVPPMANWANGWGSIPGGRGSPGPGPACPPGVGPAGAPGWPPPRPNWRSNRTPCSGDTLKDVLQGCAVLRQLSVGVDEVGERAAFSYVWELALSHVRKCVRN